ncbi:MAG: putative 4-hydroxybenzoate polyprenyltransferase [Syntrophomonas sp.]|uniref:UbiA-like polyprenyltransferase n=1 Tax=Syntrophomonas sp. TaxID=2053627 RepID=UPI0026204AC3|nr:UbiA-like polyprenyltransferase [Syntrophomonas sp.]MDD4625891.1 putative 4-hydroxybenzoate polyprenyltransferase [Syntrophomonas sp.]
MNKIREFLNMVDFGHSLFALPFAYLGAFLAAQGMPTWPQLAWITIAMVSARTAALCLNRLIDRHIDRANPRTSEWTLAAGRLPLSLVWFLVFFCFALLFYSASRLNPLCLKLSPLAVLALWLYSYTKRFTWWCHLLLGMAIGLGPVGAWIAISGSLDWQPIVLGMAVACWIAGFDSMYACQDIEFDQAHGLFSIPARFGIKGALLFSAIFHIFTFLLLLLNGVILNLACFYYAGVVFVGIILIYEHWIVKADDLSRVNFASFKINHYVGLIVFIMALLDIFL